jgi:hypothetical protein
MLNAAAMAAEWTETSFEDFADGTYSDGGTNVYTTTDGTIKFIGQQLDVNGDGYMDIIFSNYKNDSTRNINSYIYWGNASGFGNNNKTGLATHGTMGNSIVDLNNDGYLDIVFSHNHNDSTHNINSYIYWGSSTGFSNQGKTELATRGARGNSIADLNNDGYLDIVFSNHNNDSTRNINSYIYWGSAPGFSDTDKTELSTRGAAGNSIADLNNDGYLDIVFSNYHNDSTRNINSYIYWGSASGFSNEDKTELATQGAVGNFIADFNGDGYLDIVFSNYHNDSTCNINSFIYWGSAAGFSIDDVPTELQTHGAYMSTTADLGNVYNRGRELVYTELGL